MRSITGPRIIGELFRFFPAVGREGAATAGAVVRLWRTLLGVEDDDATAWENLLAVVPVFGGTAAGAVTTAVRGAGAAAWVAGAARVDLMVPEAPPVASPDAKAFTPLKA